MQTIFHSSTSRGFANHGWLVAKHSFSFASWHNPERVHFGALRVLNDDTVSGGTGFSKHPHDNMEIITIPLSGAIKHQDSMGNSSVIQTGEIQVMSAGTGVEHSEFNPLKDEALKLFQIWIFPNKKNVSPRYDQFMMDKKGMKNAFLQLVSPNQDDAGTWIHQEAWISMAEMDEHTTLNYQTHREGNGVYFMQVEGETTIGEHQLNDRDALGVWDTSEITIKANAKGKLLAIEVPMEF